MKKFGKLVAGLAMITVVIAGDKAGAGGNPLPQDGQAQATFNAMLAGGWSYNDLKREDGCAGKAYTTIVHRGVEKEGQDCPDEAKSLEPKVDYAFCVLSVDGTVEVTNTKPDVVVEWQGTAYKAKIWQGGCIHKTGPANASMVAKSERSGLVLFFKRISATGKE